MPSDSTLTLFIPDLFGFQSIFSKLSSEEKSQLPELELPVLEKWLSRGLFEKTSEQYDVAFSEFGFDEYKNKDKPFAGLSLLSEKIAELDLTVDSYWLRADPVNLQADRDTALLVAHEELNLTQDEASSLVAKINEHFIDEPWQLYTFAPHRWYIRFDKAINITTTPLAKVLGDDINAFSPMGEDADYWLKILNELQMLIHGSTVNFNRDARNILMANSIWLWGGGYIPKPKSSISYDKVITDNPVFSGAGYHCGIDVLSLGGIFSKPHKINNSFVVLDMLSEQVQRKDFYTFVQTLNVMEKDFFVKCNELLLNGSIESIKLITDAGVFFINKKQTKRWWKRVKDFSDLSYA